MRTVELDKDALLRQAAELRRKGFKPGCDDMSAKSAELWLTINGERLLAELRAGRYEPMPAQGFRTAKADGSFRQLCRLTAIDMVLERCFLDALSAECEPRFSDGSYAYRPGRGVDAALKQYCAYGSAYRYAMVLDPSDCFGSLDHGVLRAALGGFFDDGVLVEQLMRFAAMPLLEDGQLIGRERGVLQGAPLSPLFCNVYLHGLDGFIASLGLPFLRYADDVVIFGNEYGPLKAQGEKLAAFMRRELGLTLNRKKCVIDAPFKLRYLGHRFIVGKEGFLTLEENESVPAAWHAWQQRPIKNPGRSVYVISDGILRQKDLSLMLDTDGGDYDVPIMNTDCINLFSNVVFDSGFLRAAAERGILLNLFDQHGHLCGRFVPNAPLRAPLVTHEQLAAYYNAERRLALARAFVLGSIHNLRLNIRYYQKNYPDKSYTAALRTISELEKQITECEEHPALLLLEARVRAAYYGCFEHFLRNGDFHFDGRTRRPPRDPVNAMLSFGNTLLYSYLASEISRTSLDVRVGFLHATTARLESLNLDVAELFKPLIVDRLVFTMINRGQIRADRHFTRAENGGVLLNAEGKRLFIEEFNDKLRVAVRHADRQPPKTYAELMREEVRKLVRVFRSGEKYKPFKQVR